MKHMYLTRPLSSCCDIKESVGTRVAVAHHAPTTDTTHLSSMPTLAQHPQICYRCGRPNPSICIHRGHDSLHTISSLNA